MTYDAYGSWYDQPWVVFDVETTGLRPEQHRVVQVGLALFERGELLAKWSSILNPECEVPVAVSNIHGITTTMVADAPKLIEVIPEIIRLCRGALPCAYNAPFDQGFLRAELSRLSLKVDMLPIPLFNPAFRWADPLVWSRQIDAQHRGHKLAEACARRGVSLERAHDAAADAVAAGQLFFTMADDIGPITVTELLRLQALHAARTEALWAASRAKKRVAH